MNQEEIGKIVSYEAGQLYRTLMEEFNNHIDPSIELEGDLFSDLSDYVITQITESMENLVSKVSGVRHARS